MTLTDLRYIVAVARERHFGRAAETCFVSQPTLSIAVRKLEKELAVALFERRLNEIVPTPIGAKIIAQAQRTLEAAEMVKHLAKEGQDQLNSPLRIGALHTIGPYLFPELVPVLHQAAPSMPLMIEENYTATLTEKLKQGELDVILVSLPFEERGILLLPLYEEPFVVLLPSAHPLTENARINPQALEKADLLLMGAGHCFRNQVLRACPACVPQSDSATSHHTTLEGGSLETIRHMVASGLGLTVFPCTAAGADRYTQRLLTIRRFTEPVPYRHVALAWRSTFTRPKVVDVIKQAVSDCNISCVKRINATATR